MKFFNKYRLIAFMAGTTVAFSPFLQQLAQAQSPDQMFPLLAGVELTQQQQTQLTQLRTQTLNQIKSIIRPKQFEAFKTALSQGQTFRQAIAASNLSNEQKAQLQQLLLATREQANNVLTLEQKQQLRQNLRNKISQWRGNR